MIETCIILSILLGGGWYLAARLAKQNARKNPAVEMARLSESIAWHEARLRQARERNWDREMIHQITEQIEDTRFQLAQVSGRAGK